jgi:hypothetical protein
MVFYGFNWLELTTRFVEQSPKFSSMIELKVQCDCGQKYKFDVEPVNGQMPFRVNCPLCGADGTAKANLLLQTQAPVATAAAMPAPAQLRLNVAAPPPVAPPLPPAQRYPSTAGAPRVPLPAASTAKNAGGTTNLALGAVGALLGAALGAGIMYGFYALAGFRFPLMGTGVGLLTGLGARILYRGTDHALGAISGAIAAVAVVGTLYLMYGEFPVFNIISVIISVSFAYKMAA